MVAHQLNPDEWIKRYSDYLFNYTISRVKDRETAQDLVQDTFFAGLKSMKNFIYSILKTFSFYFF